MKSDRRHFLTDAVIYGVGGVLMQLVSVLLLPLYTQYLEPSDYGTMDIIERIGQVINICLMTGGVRQACLAFYLQGGYEDRRRLAATISLLLFAIFVAAGLLLCASSSFLTPLLGIDDKMLFIFGVLVVLSQMFTIVPFSLMQARVESISFISWQLAMLVARVTLTIIFVALFGWGIWGIYWSLLIVFAGFGCGLMAREFGRGSLKIDWHQCAKMASFSLPFIPTGLCSFFLFNGDRFFLAGTVGTAALGIYALGYKLASAVGLVTSAPLFKVWSAKMYAVYEHPNAGHVAGRMLTRIITAYLFIGMGLCLFHMELLTLMSSTAYQSAGTVIAPIVLAHAFLFANTFMEGVFYVFHKTKYKPVTALLGMVAILILYATLIPLYSINGAAYATLLGYWIMAAITYIVAQRVFQVKYEFGRLTMLVSLSISCYLPSIFLGLGATPFLARIGLFLLWCGLAWHLGLIHNEDKEMVFQLLSKANNRWNRFK